MGNSYGRQVLESTGRPIQVSADGRPIWKVGGVTIDWSLVTALVAQQTLADETVVPIGGKYLRYGTILGVIGAAEVQTVTFTGGPTAGAAIITLPAAGDAAAQVAAGVAFDASAQAVQDALNALPRLGVNGVTVARTGAGTAGDPYVYTVTFNRALGNVPQFTSTHTFTGGTSPTTTHATSTAGTGNGKYGPIDTTATDGRQTMSRGNCFILNETVVESEPCSDHPAVIEGGAVWAARLLVNGTGQPTLANFLTAFPAVQLVND